MNRAKPFILLGVAIFIALITSLLVYYSLKKKGGEQDTAALKTKPAVVAKVNFPWGKVLSQNDVVVKQFLADSIPPGALANAAAVNGRVLRYPVGANELILESNLAPLEGAKGGGFAAVVTPKKRAMAIKVDKVVGVSGFIFPGDRVDVYVTLTPHGGPQGDKTLTKLVLENMLVLSVGAQLEEKGQKEKQALTDVITLEVTPEEGEKLALAMQEGRMVLALRNYTDTETVTTRGTTVSNLLASFSSGSPIKTGSGAGVGPSPIQVRAKGSKAPGAPGKPEQKEKEYFVVELIQGGKISQTKFEKGK
jgi:pilus assembly protein CpaB